MNKKRLHIGLAAALVAATAAAFMPGAAASATSHRHHGHGGTLATWEVVADGLANPRGIETGPWNSLVVAEAGKGGTTDCQDGTDPDSGQPVTNCLGDTGAVDLIVGHHIHKLVSLPSVAGTDGTSASGPTHASVTWKGILVSMMGIEPLPYSGDTSKFDKLLRLGWGGVTTVADPGAFEAANNPDGNQIDSDPYGLAPTDHGAVMTDAGGNSVIKVGEHGDISLIAALPPQDAIAPPFLGLPPGATIPAESVPTSVVRGPDGAWYVGELTGFPFQEGLARVWRIVPGHAPTVFATGFTNIIDLQFDRRGNLYVLEMARHGLLVADTDPNGALIKIDRHGNQTTVASDGLTLPGGVAITDDGRIYVTLNSISPDAGQVVRIR